jgi:transposase
MQATTIGIDLAKHVFQLHGVDQHGKTVLTRKLKRDQMISFFANLPSQGEIMSEQKQIKLLNN